MAKKKAPTLRVRMSGFFRPRTPRARGGSKKTIGFRCPDAIYTWIGSIKKLGYSQSEAMVEVLTIARDIIAPLDGTPTLRLVLENEAEKRGVSVGEAIAQMALERAHELYPEFFREKNERGKSR